jgi:O-acetyl-ADP-ribose deacetylase (regulator of RNase III)
MQFRIGSISVECVTGDIADQRDMDAVVNAANAQLEPGGGVSGALHRKAGPGLAEEGGRLAPLHTGEAVMTAGYGLPNRHVIHCLGPVYGHDEPSAVLLARCYRNALLLAEKEGIASIAFPAISTGIFGYPLEEAARIAVGTVLTEAPQLKNLRLIRFVLFDRPAYEVYARMLEDVH